MVKCWSISFSLEAVVQHVETIYTLKEDVGNAFLGVRLVNITGPLETNVNVR